jgi:two-component system chemotaxis response regulator CheY
MHAMARILVIDDDAQTRALVCEVLEHADYNVTEAPNAAIGIERYRAEPTDLVITDLRMPGMNDLDAIIALRHDFPEARIIAVSGGGGEPRDLLAVAQALGAARTLQKPFDLWDLMEVVQDVLEN